ncbi:alpha/beta hydrolase [Oligoflexus tunisiensis]|uniref:alpha/beta hydrolase n=1 Tax=Oligoflexus tunisiensis TaxID=708132 RepID=UPI00114D028C|nr:dienelactone hydrolase family protein [Oligoflexus tunisiensis]
MRNFQVKKLAGLDCIVTEKPGNQKAVILLHGYGADFRDLASLAVELDPEENYDWYFPNGILPVAIGPHVEGRAWFPIDMVALQASLQTGNRRPFADRVPEGLTRASEAIQELLGTVQKTHKTVVLGGFSQGAMVSLDVSLHSPEKPAALVQLSGSLVAMPRWEPQLARLAGIKVFQSHGQGDPILPFDASEDLARLFKQYEYELEFVHFPGGHEIPWNVMTSLRKFLSQV